MDRITKSPRSSALRRTLFVFAFFCLSACVPASRPTPVAVVPVAPRASPAVSPARLATATPATEFRVLTLPLPASWAPVAAPSHAWELPSLWAVGPAGAQLTGTLIPRRDLTLTHFVEETATRLSQQRLNVRRSGVVFGLRTDGAPLGIVEYDAAGDAEAIQWSLLTGDAQSILTVTLVTSPDQTAALRAAIGDMLVRLDPDFALK